MRNFTIQFQYPWLLLLLIPAYALTIVLYLLLNKKFRRTRNRVISIILHCIVMTLCICVLAGIGFRYEISNLENEIILLVDVSETEARSAERRDEFVRTVITECGYDGYKVGVVTFGFDQKYAVPLTYNAGAVYQNYLDAEKPDTSATNIAAALKFVSDNNLFLSPETAKIVLITDGKETDEQASAVIGSIAKRGIVVDTVHIASEYEEDKVQVVGVEYPVYHINQNEAFTLNVLLRCKADSPQTTVQVYDNGVLAEEMSRTVDLDEGEHSVSFQTSFASQGLHEIEVKIGGEDGLKNNNEYSSYYYLEVFGHVLIIEHRGGESEALKAMLNEEAVYAESGVDVLNLEDRTDLPTTVEELRNYDQIILNNISNGDLKDLPVPDTASTEDGEDWFVKLLYSYVYDYGGGLLTVGGKEDDGVELKAHAYNRADLYNTLYQQMLPVQAIDYKPPVAVMIIIDISGSMGSGEDGSPLYYAKQGAISCLDALSDRDYVGIMTLDTVYGTILPLTSRTEETRIREAILGIGTGEATVFSSAIKTAGERLRQQTNVDKRHIVIVTDGMPGEQPEDYLPIARDLYETSGVTISVVGVEMSESGTYEAMKELTDAAGGQTHTASGRELIDEMRGDLEAPAIKEFNYENFYPVVSSERSPLLNGVEYGAEGNRRQFNVTLGGFFGVKARENADVVLMGDYEVPIYAQWKYGKGMVGSFMCDLDGSDASWSKEFMADRNGRRFLYNVIANLMPTQDIRPGDLRFDLEEGNYINRLSVFTELSDGQKIVGKIVEHTADGDVEYSMNAVTENTESGIYVTDPFGVENHYSRCGFVVKKGGVYKIVIEKYEAGGTLSSSVTVYKAFSYSREYDSFAEESEATLADLADLGGGRAIPEDDPWSLFESFVPVLERYYDPRLAFLIIAMVLFLGDIAVRKFKFKWIHELVREHRAKKAESK